MQNVLIFLGTGAADIDFHINPKESFENRDFRRCSCALLGDEVMLDCGPFAINSLNTLGKSPADIRHIVFTHLHSDHFSAEAVQKIALAANRLLHVWVRFDAKLPPLENCDIHFMELFREYSVGPYKITGVPANHQVYPQHLSIASGEKKLFYGLDGAWFLGDTVRFMQNQQYAAVVLDATVGDYLGDYRIGEHNSIPMLRVMVPSLRTLHALTDESQIILTHLAHSLHKSYAETMELVKNDGFIIAYDGYHAQF